MPRDTYYLTLLAHRGKLPEDYSQALMQLIAALVHHPTINDPLYLWLWLIATNREFRRSVKERMS